MYLPDGVKDYMTDELTIKRDIENTLGMLFTKWGYNEVLPPYFEYYRTFKNTLKSTEEKDIYRFFDRNGDILALRPDVTPQIARIAATRCIENINKFYYITNVFRYDEPQAGRMRQFTQAGIEYIGLKGEEIDSEVLILAIKALKKIGLKDFKIDIGHTGYLNSLIKQFNINNEENEKKIIELISQKNLSSLYKFLDDIKIDRGIKKDIMIIPELFGDIHVIERAGLMTRDLDAKRALQSLTDVYRILDGLNMGNYLSFDLGIAQDFNYYTGIIFKGYVKDIGYSILSGGRYDGLLSKFNVDKPAVGFALGVERTILALIKQEHIRVDRPKKYLIPYSRENINEAYIKADSLRSGGNTVVMIPLEHMDKYRSCDDFEVLRGGNV